MTITLYGTHFPTGQPYDKLENQEPTWESFLGTCGDGDRPNTNGTKTLSWQLLENVLRNYHEFRELYVREGIEEVQIEGFTVNVHDVLQGLEELPERQREAIELTCLRNMREVDAASIMLPDSKWSSPVGAYKRTGLQKLVDKYYTREKEEAPRKYEGSGIEP